MSQSQSPSPSLFKRWPSFLETLISFIFPPVCVSCRSPVEAHGLFCASCWREFEYLTPPFCDTCGTALNISMDIVTTCGQCLSEPPPFHKTRALFVYNKMAKRLILRFKDYGATYLASFFAKWLALKGQDILKDGDLLIPVPLHTRKLIRRGYNQAALLVKNLSPLTKTPYALDILGRHRQTLPQGRMSAKDRTLNIKGAFYVKDQKNLLRGKNIILVDDVMSSGATLKECTNVLKKAGAKQVDVLVIARAKLR